MQWEIVKRQKKEEKASGNVTTVLTKKIELLLAIGHAERPSYLVET
jgi:hypothetical protein